MKLYQTTPVQFIGWCWNPRTHLPEFPLVKEVWYHYPQQEVNPAEGRIFGTFVNATLVAVARHRSIRTVTKLMVALPWKSTVDMALPGSSCRN